MKRRLLLQAAGAGTLAAGLPLRAATAIPYGHSASTDYASVFAAVDKGMFAKRGLQVQPQLITINSTIPAALQSGSLLIAGPTSTTFLQAVDSGLDLVVLGGGGCYTDNPNVPPAAGLVTRTGVHVRDPKDAIGKKVGVPGLGSVLQVMFRAWLLAGGVDPKQVRFVEIPLPQQADVLKSGAIDAVVSVDPFMSRIIASGIGQYAVNYSTSLPEGLPTTIQATTRAWAEKNRDAVKAFQAAIAEGAAFVDNPANDAEVRALIGKYNRVPEAFLPKIVILKPAPVVTAAQLRYWMDLMDAQDMLKKKLDPAQLIFAS